MKTTGILKRLYEHYSKYDWSKEYRLWEHMYNDGVHRYMYITDSNNIVFYYYDWQHTKQWKMRTSVHLDDLICTGSLKYTRSLDEAELFTEMI